MLPIVGGIRIESSIHKVLEDNLHDKRFSILGYLVALLFSTKIEGEVFLIGSYARGDYNSESDIDLMINANPLNAQKIATIASKLEWTFEIPVQVVSIQDLDEIPSESCLLYSSIHPQKSSTYYLISYQYLTKNRSKITVFTRTLKKFLASYGGKKLGPKVFLVPIQFPLSLILNKWGNLIKLREQLLITGLTQPNLPE